VGQSGSSGAKTRRLKFVAEAKQTILVKNPVSGKAIIIALNRL